MLEGLNIHHKNFPKNIITKFVCLVIIDERPPMGSQLNLASRSKVVLIYKYHAKISGALTQNLGRKKHHFWTTFFCDFRTGHRLSLERNEAWSNKNGRVNLQCVLYKVTHFS